MVAAQHEAASEPKELSAVSHAKKIRERIPGLKLAFVLLCRNCGKRRLPRRIRTDRSGENRHHMPVAVVGKDVKRQLLPNMDPVDKWIEVDGHALEIVGVMDRPATSLPGQNDTRVL